MTSETDGSNTKVGRVIEERGLDGMGATLEAAWTGESGERTSLRDLADEFNEAVLEAALREAGVSSLNVEVESTYEALRSDSGPEATRARRRLEREGVDVEELTGDFVTHQAVHTYLTREREASLPESDDDLAERKVETVEKLQGRVAAVTESALASLANADELDRDGYEVLVDVRAVCPDCGTDTPVGELIRRGGCGCTDDAGSGTAD
ncbi:rod-determining factor RdfA [Halorubrum amylolyticum]|uniref:rod-determining factor RdfA n=1 Tax=Halorubrum amylolyticum TaxID=2508724 RepID=UPI001008DB81|nr:rod-determining factor RdfA [Halorubrum amylolyticum]